jgi:hypothetical protein
MLQGGNDDAMRDARRLKRFYVLLRRYAPYSDDPDDFAGHVVRRLLMARRFESVERSAKRALQGGDSIQRSRSAKQSGHWKVDIMGRAPDTLINGNYYDDPKDPGMPRRRQESCFDILINPNMTFGPEFHGEAKHRFDRALQYLRQPDTAIRYLKFGPKDAHYALDIPQDVITDIDVGNSIAEVGGVMRRMHAHLVVKIEHYSQVQIDIPAIKREFMESYHNMEPPMDFQSPLRLPPNIYLHVKRMDQSNAHAIKLAYNVKDQ